MQPTSTPASFNRPAAIAAAEITLRYPAPQDGADMWNLAKETGVLDLNSSYAYLMWSRDFSATSIVAEVDGQFAGFITGYLRPCAPQTLMIWQVATAQQFRGRGVAATMLARLFDRCVNRSNITTLETTITADNPASIALFTSFARERNLPVAREVLFPQDLFPDAHDSEFGYRIGPVH